MSCACPRPVVTFSQIFTFVRLYCYSSSHLFESSGAADTLFYFRKYVHGQVRRLRLPALHCIAILGMQEARQVQPMNLAVRGLEKLGKCDGRRHRERLLGLNTLQVYSKANRHFKTLFKKH